MMAEFREISTGLLKNLQREPSLTPAVILADLIDDGTRSDVEVLLRSLPPKQREAMTTLYGGMAPEQRSKMEATAARAVAALRDSAVDVLRQARGRTFPPGEIGERIGLEKAWHGVHYLLCGSSRETPDPVGQAVLGGTAIGPDRGYGPARYLDARQVSVVAEGLSGLDRAALPHRFDPAAMESAQIYPGGWGEPDTLAWLLDALEDLIRFYIGVADRGNAVLLYLK